MLLYRRLNALPSPLLLAVVLSDYVRLLKYGDSLYRCKQLKRAALVRFLVEANLDLLPIIGL